MVHLQRFQQDGPELGFHHPKTTLYNGASPGMIDVEAPAPTPCAGLLLGVAVGGMGNLRLPE